MRPETALYLSAFLIAFLGIAHSILGERYILTRLFRRDDLPRILGSSAFTTRTLRFAWHLTTLLAIAIAVVLAQLAAHVTSSCIVSTIGWMLIASGILPLLFTRGRHLSWVVLFAAGALCLYGAGA